MHHQNLNYANKDNDTLMEVSTSFPHQTLAPVGQNGHDMLDYGTMDNMMMDASYFGGESMDLQSTFGSMTLFPNNQVEVSQHQSMTQQQTAPSQEQISLEQFGSTPTTMHITSAPVVKSQASLVKNEDLWSPPANYHVPPTPLPTGVIQSWPPVENGIASNSNNINNKNSDQFITPQQPQQQPQQHLHQQQQQENSDPTPSHWYQPSSYSPSYRDMMLSDVCPTPSPVLASPSQGACQYGSPAPQEDVKPQVTTAKKVNAVRRSLPRRHTVSTVYNSPLDHIHNNSSNNNNNPTTMMLAQQQKYQQQQQQQFYSQQQQYPQQPNQQHQDVNQQAKMRKMLKARRHRSLGRLEVPSHYLTKLDTGYHAASSSSSCGPSRCASPLSAECLSNEQLLDRVMISLEQQTSSHPSYPQQQYHQHPSDENDPDISSYPSFLVQPIYQTSPPLPATNALPPAPIVQSQQQQQQQQYHHHHHQHHLHQQQPHHLQMMEDDLYSMAATSHTSTNTAPTSPVLIPLIDDESEPDELGERISQQEMEGPHICQWADCRLEFQLLDHLIEHTKVLHIGSGKPLYYCRWKDCSRGDKPFTKRHKMHNHLRTHTKERPYVCMEEGCGKRFARPDSMATHTKIHTNIRPYACQHENCDKAYYHLRSLRKHEKSHEVPPPLPTPSLMDHHLSVLELKD